MFNNGVRRPDGSFSSVDEIVLPVDASGRYAYKAGKAYGPEKAVWSYAAPKKSEFFSMMISGAERQPNGNTLICSGANGTIFEVTPAKETVWKYVNPVRRGMGPAAANPKGGPSPKGKGGGAPTPGAVFRAYRYAPEYPGLTGRNLSASKT